MKPGGQRRNRPTNLQWATALVNNRDRYVHGTMPRGETSGSNKLTSDQVIWALDRLHSGATSTEVASMLGVSRGLMKAIRAGKLWRHLPRPETSTFAKTGRQACR